MTRVRDLIGFFNFVAASPAGPLLPTRPLAKPLVNLFLTKFHSLACGIVLLMIICGVLIWKGKVKPIRQWIKTNSLVIVMFPAAYDWAFIVTEKAKAVRPEVGPGGAAAIVRSRRLPSQRR